MILGKHLLPRWFPILLFALAAAVPGCSLPDETAAVVDGLEIPTAELDRAYEEFLDEFGEMAPPGAEETAKAKKVLLARLVDQALIDREIGEMGLRPSEEELSAEVRRIQGDLSDEEFESVLSEAGLNREECREKTTRDLALEKLQRQIVGAVEVSDEQIEEYLREHRRDFEVPEEVRASQILVRTKEEAQQAAKRINGGEPFDTVAQEVSLSPDAEHGGDLGYFTRGQMPQEFDAVVFSLPVGKLSPVVETTYGHHLFLVADRRETKQREGAEVRRHIRDLLQNRGAEQAYRDWLGALREKAEIRYNDKVLFD